MARKDVLKGLLESLHTPPAGGEPAAPPAPPRASRGAIGAVSRSIADLKARSVVELDPHLIDAGGLQDRLESDDAADTSLRESIAGYGQQVPVLVRPHPEAEGRFQIVYGRRRVLALRDLGLPVKALIRDLDDRELVLAQGQENTARRDLSFIEKVNFASQLQDHGYDRKVICDALSIDKTLANRMLSLAERLPAEVIAVIGAAPAVGRDRWTRLAEMLHETGTETLELAAMVNLQATSPASDARFIAAWDYLAGLLAPRPRPAPAAPRPAPQAILSADGTRLGLARRGRGFSTIRLTASGFDRWLLDQLPRLHADWQREAPPDKGDPT